MHASARPPVFSTQRLERDRTAGDQQSANQAINNPQCQCSRTIASQPPAPPAPPAPPPPPPLHFLLRLLHYLLSFLPLSVPAFGGNVHLYITELPAALRLPPSPRSIRCAAALLAPAILTNRCPLLPSYSFHETANSDKYHHTPRALISLYPHMLLSSRHNPVPRRPLLRCLPVRTHILCPIFQIPTILP